MVTDIGIRDSSRKKALEVFQRVKEKVIDYRGEDQWKRCRRHTGSPN